MSSNLGCICDKLRPIRMFKLQNKTKLDKQNKNKIHFCNMRLLHNHCNLINFVTIMGVMVESKRKANYFSIGR